MIEPLVTEGDRHLQAAFSTPPRITAARAVLLGEGEPQNPVLRLHSGWAVRVRFLPNGRRAVLAIHLPGDLIGLGSLLARSEGASVIALTAAAYQSVAADELRRLILARPEGMLRVVHLVDRERRRLEDLTIALGRCNAEQRVALLLLDLHSRLRSKKLIEATAFRLPLTQAEIGDHLGLTVVHVNRVLRSLREQGIASISHGVATIHNLERLRGSAETPLPEEREPGRQAE